MEDGYHDELSTFKLGYDLTEIKSSSYYAEASEYIKKDLPSPLTTPEDLEKLVTKFNNDVDEFILKVIPSNTYDILRTITTISNTKKGAVPTADSISLENIIPFIQRYWILNHDFDINYQNGSVTFDHQVVARIAPELKDNFIAAIQKLKTESKMFQAINGNLITGLEGLKDRRASLIGKRKDLVQFIHNIISKIEGEEYHMD
jgi:hypothetical protein